MRYPRDENFRFISRLEYEHTIFGLESQSGKRLDRERGIKTRNDLTHGDEIDQSRTISSIPLS